MKKIIYFLFALFAMTSCDNNEDLVNDNSNNDTKENVICKEALAFANSVHEMEGTRNFSSNLMKVKNVNKVPVEKFITTRAENDNHNFYAVSLTDKQGTVIMSENNGATCPLAYFMDENNIDVEAALNDSTSDMSFILQSAISDQFFDPIYITIEKPLDGSHVVEHQIPKCKVSWHQNAPYNRYCYTSDGKQAAAGCVAIAGAQALSVLQPQLDCITSWSAVTAKNPTDAAIDEIAKLVSFVGKEVSTNYGTSSSSSKTERLVNLFKKYNITDYDAPRAIDVLRTKHGVIVVSGYRAKHGWGPTEHYVDGHAFLADGYIKYDNIENDPYYLHLNYGWGPDTNKNVYLLSSKKHWKEEEAKEAYGTIFTHKIKFYTYTYENEKRW